MLGAVVVFLLPRRAEGLVKLTALVTSLVTFAVSIPLFTRFDASLSAYQFVEQRAWMPTLGVSYHLGVDGISLLLVLLTTFLMPLVLLSSWHSIERRWKDLVARRYAGIFGESNRCLAELTGLDLASLGYDLG